jgi:Tol biopolymer transport system component
MFARPQALAERQLKWRLPLPWVAAAVVVAAIIVGGAVWKLKLSEPRQVMRSEYTVPEGQQLGDPFPILAVSPDGKQFVYSTPKGLYLRSLDAFDAKLISGTETNPTSPFFSPDGKWIGYYSRSDNKLKKIAISGGAPVTLCDVSFQVAGASWSADGIVYSDAPIGLARVSANGGTPELIFKGDLFTPQLLPDGKSVLFTSGAPPFKIAVQSLQSGERKELFTGDTARYIPTGHILYLVGNNLMAVPFDFKTLKVTGEPVPVVEGVWRVATGYTPQYAVSDSGTLVYIPGTIGAFTQRTLVWLDRNGKEVSIGVTPNDYSEPDISPDGTKLALTVISGEKSDIWILDLLRGTMTRLTFNESSAYPLWTRDSKRIVFMSGNLLESAVYWKAADGTGADNRLIPNRLSLIPWSWSSDGQTLLLTEAVGGVQGGSEYAIDALPLEGNRKLSTLLKEKYQDRQPHISPDGRWMVYVSNESGKNEIYVRPFPDVDKGKWQISVGVGGGEAPLWSPDGRELFYRNGDSVMAVAVETGQTFKCGKPEPLFRGTYTSSYLQDLRPWDISPDGKRFLMMKEAGSPASAALGPRKINIVLNWFEELKQKVPVK